MSDDEVEPTNAEIPEFGGEIVTVDAIQGLEIVPIVRGGTMVSTDDYQFLVCARNAHAAMKRGWWAVRDANGRYVVRGGPGGFNPTNTVHSMDAKGNPHRFDDPFEALDAAEQAAKGGGR